VDPAGETFRGPRPASEPETRALDRLMRRVGFEFLISYHSTASQLLYGTAWQVDTPPPDDVVYEALAGDDDESAVPGYDPDRWADLGVGNGEIAAHAHVAHGTFAYTAEMSSCAAEFRGTVCSPPARDSGFEISTELIAVRPSVATADTVLFGYGIEALATPGQRADALGRAIEHLLRTRASR
jgi:hypothetical protein